MSFTAPKGNQQKAIFAKFNAPRGEFDVSCQATDEGAIKYIVSKGEHQGEERYRQSHKGIEGKLSAVSLREDEYMGNKSLYVDMAFADANPENPAIVVTATLMGGDSGAVYQSVLGMMESLNKADLSRVLNVSVANNPAGSKFITKDDKGVEVEVTREFASSTVFVRHTGDEPKNFLRDDRTARPPVVEIKNKAGKVVGKDYDEQLSYAKGVVGQVAGKVEVERNRMKDLMKAASTQTQVSDDSVVFGG